MSAGVDAEARLRREIEHHKQIAARAEIVWNWDSPTGRQRAERRARFFVSDGGLRPGTLALEIGCGTGVFLERTAKTGARIDAIDLSEELLGKARRRLAASGNVALVCGNVEKMPYADATFDTAYGSSVLHHLNLEPALVEIRRVLKPGGRIVFAEPNIWNPHIAFTYLVGPRSVFGLSDDEMAFSRGHAARVLAACGFGSIEVVPYDFLHPLVPAPLIPTVQRWSARLERLPLVREIAGSLRIVARRPE